MADQNPRNNQQQDRQVQSLERIYAGALLDLATEANRAESIAGQMEELAQLMERDAGLARIIASHMLSTKVREGIIERVFKGRVDDVLYRFLLVVNRKDRLSELPAIARAFDRLYQERLGIVEVDAYVSQRLGEAEAQEVATRIGQVLGQQVVLHQYVDPNLIGGLKLRVGDRVIDGSVATQLKIMREKMIAAGRERAKTSITE